MMVDISAERILSDIPVPRQSFIFLLAHLNGQKEIIGAEIGTFKGLNAASMLNNCPKLKLYCIDGYERICIKTGGPFVSETEKKHILGFSNVMLEHFGNRAIRIFKQSEESYTYFPDEYFDYVYIDGEHLYDWVKRDIELWYPKVKNGGILAGHDFGMPEVMRAVSEFRYYHKNLNFSVSHGSGESDWWFIKNCDFIDSNSNAMHTLSNNG